MTMLAADSYTAHRMDPIEFKTNPFGGVLPDPKALPGPEEIRVRLDHSLDIWRNEGYQAVWLEIPLDQAYVVPVAAEAGFEYHHANSGYVMMTRKLEENTFLPLYATHYIGAGGVVINGNKELLVVREKRDGQASGSFKLPGGHILEGEHLAQGVVREVLEETGIESRFISLVGFRHQHGYRHGKSDIYFICRLEALSDEITMQEDEIAEAAWIPVADYLSSESASVFNRRVVEAAVKAPPLQSTFIEGYRDPSTVEVYLPKDDS